ncbi:PROTEIN PTST-like protein 3 CHLOROPLASTIC [Salix viminalis]|uniref:PROTEIN PTST-like protein 3 CHLOROPLASTIC n=1 Tax=Salix viminalis TaxID=40686 RepID=A0A9Q0U1N7_SALVM|nr:PROTEIN PTST-like protein 3 CHLOROPLASTIC [Salix viminalis]
MLSITHAPTCFINLSPQIFPPYNSTSNAHNLIRKGKTKNLELRFLAVKETSGGGFFELKNSSWGSGGEFVRRCNRRDWEGSGGNIDLETKILEFMNSSINPEMFPSKKQLIDAGRMDLVEAILKEGGWLALGWDFDDNVDDVDVVDWYSSLTDNKDCGDAGIQDKAIERNEEQSSQVPCSSSGRSIDIATEDDAGIGGILYRLEKERNMNLGVALKEIETITRVQSSNVNHDWLHKTTKNGTVAGLNANNTPGLLNPKSSVISDLRGGLDHSRSFSNIDGSGNSLNPDTWRTWSIKRAAFLDVKFEAEELSSNRTCTGGEESVLGDEIIETKDGASETVSRRKENRSDGWINQNQVRSRLHDLELELSSVLQSLKSNTGESVSQKVDNGRASDDLLKLSDALEFQENEIINAQDKLRSTRAKIAVSEGKIALAIIDAQKVVEEKQKRIDDVSRALQVLRTACIVWPGSASVVFLTGSFDGWAIQRRMEKSSLGVFSLYLKLFPGRYEIKFIVDDEWKIDPLRPIVHNNGYENNLLIIT